MIFSLHQNMEEGLKMQLMQGGKKGNGKEKVREICEETVFQG